MWPSAVLLPSGSVKEHPQLSLKLECAQLVDDMESQPPLVRGNTSSGDGRYTRIGGTMTKIKKFTRLTRLTDTETVMFAKRATLWGSRPRGYW